MAYTARQSIEMFHLVFVRALLAKGDDKSLIALKGGCNLRFYFGSPRYSEDIDFDVVVIAKGTLRNKVERLLESPLVTMPLKSRGMEVIEVSAPKQTDATQRWKAVLSVQGFPVALRTKIEFSRRDAIEGAAYEAIDVDVVRAHGLTPVLATHYRTHAAVAQKIQALVGRAETQARDVFDLHLLLSRPEANTLKGTGTPSLRIDTAIERAMEVSFDAYTSKVVAYLDPAQSPLYEGRAAWNAMQEFVVSQLESLR